MWQRFMTRLLKYMDVKERVTEHDLRGKVGSDVASIEEQTTCSDPQAEKLQSGTIAESQKPLNPSADPAVHARNSNRRCSQVARISHDVDRLLTWEWGTTPRDSLLFWTRKQRERTAFANRMGEILIYGGRLLRFLRVMSKTSCFSVRWWAVGDFGCSSDP